MSLSGNPFDFFLAFLFGIGISFTPCVYPLVPITVAYIAGRSANSKIKGFILTLIYVSGISITYVTLGLVAVLTGSIFGHFSSLPLVRIIAGLIIILFGFTLWTNRGLSLSGLRLPVVKKSGTYLSCFILGVTSGFVISPCITPALGSILAYVATTRNFLYGTLLLFSFAYGMGFLLILAGTFSSILTALPKSGYWMENIKKICSIILIAAGIYFVISGITNIIQLEERPETRIIMGFLTGLAYAQDSETSIKELDFALSDIDGNKIILSEFKNKKSVILFFWTIWCPSCIRELDKLNRIYPSLISEDIEILAINVQESKSRVRRFLSRNAVDFKVLLDSDAYVANLYGLIGVPTFVFINKQGEIVFLDNYSPLETYRRF